MKVEARVWWNVRGNVQECYCLLRKIKIGPFLLRNGFVSKSIQNAGFLFKASDFGMVNKRINCVVTGFPFSG